MIRTLGEMLETLRRAEARRLDEVDIKHAPTIGEMYEGLTQDVLDRAIPPGLDLKVVSGFAIDGNGGTTGQLDCMLVRGAGIPVPYTAGKFQWHVKDVLAVFEVKKTLCGRLSVGKVEQLLRIAGWCGHVSDLLVRRMVPLAVMPFARFGSRSLSRTRGAWVIVGFPDPAVSTGLLH